MEGLIRKHIIFYGRVQGVGFRYRSYYSAQKLGLTGWIRNVSDGTVEMEIQGKETSIDALIMILDKSDYIEIHRMLARKTQVDKEERGFRILES